MLGWEVSFLAPTRNPGELTRNPRYRPGIQGNPVACHSWLDQESSTLCLCAFVPLCLSSRLCAVPVIGYQLSVFSSFKSLLCAWLRSVIPGPDQESSSPLCLCAFVPLCLSSRLCAFLHAFVPLCLCAFVPLCLSSRLCASLWEGQAWVKNGKPSGKTRPSSESRIPNFQARPPSLFLRCWPWCWRQFLQDVAPG